MPKNRVILDEKSICDEYLNTKIGIEAMALKYHVGKLKIKQILSNNGIEFKKKGGQSGNNVFVVGDFRIKKYEDSDDYHYEVIDKNTSFKSLDINNNGGFLTSYIKKQYNVEIPTLYDRRMYYMKTGNYWWEQWLSYRKVENLPVKKCPFCDWTTTDVKNKSGAFEQHLLTVHNITKKDYIEKFPEDRNYFALVSKYLNLRLLETDPNKFITCKICGEKMARISNSHLQKHNMTREEYISKFGSGSMVCKEFHDAMHDIAVKVNSSMQYHNESSKENELSEYIKTLNVSYEQNRSVLRGKELDAYIPNKNIAFEFDGLYWHNELFKDIDYHLKKTEDCEKQGIQLIHIFEDEWICKNHIVKSRIKSLLGIIDKKIYARECIIKELPFSVYKSFMNDNHIQGNVTAKYRYGLFYDDVLVCAMSFSNLRKSLGSTYVDGEFELVRFCNKLNTVVVGGASKLLKHFIKEIHPSKIISYADRRWSNGNLYEKLGFIHIRNSKPSYFYILNGQRYNRFAFRKDVLVKEGYNASKSEHEIMLERKIYRIYDCGTMVYELNIKKNER